MNVFPPVLHFAYDPIFQKKKKNMNLNEAAEWMKQLRMQINGIGLRKWKAPRHWEKQN